MDTLTHALSGALCARMTAPSPAPQAATALPLGTRVAVGFWAAAFPDSDFVIRFFDPLTYLATHRGLTHSVLMAPLWAGLLALIFTFIYRRRYRPAAFFTVSLLGIAVHIAGDVITAFGTMIFQPLSDLRVALPTTFIIDPLFSGIIVAGLVASYLRPASRIPSAAAFALLLGYIAAQGVLHARALEVAESYARDQAPGAVVQALPQPFSPFHWYLVLIERERYHLAYVSLARREPYPEPAADAHWLRRTYAAYRPPEALTWRVVPRFGNETINGVPVAELWEREVPPAYRQFALFPALLRIDRDAARTCVWFSDLRFSLVGRDAPFRYGVCQQGAGGWRAHRLLWDGTSEPLPR